MRTGKRAAKPDSSAVGKLGCHKVSESLWWQAEGFCGRHLDGEPWRGERVFRRSLAPLKFFFLPTRIGCVTACVFGAAALSSN